MTKYKYNKISTMRTFAESPAKWFMVEEIKMTRKEFEKLPYNAVKSLILKGKVQSVQVRK